MSNINTPPPKQGPDYYNSNSYDKAPPANPWLSSYLDGIDERLSYLSINPNYITFYKRHPLPSYDSDSFQSNIMSKKAKLAIPSLFDPPENLRDKDISAGEPSDIISSEDNRPENLQKNKINAFGSVKSTIRIKLAINWLVNISKKQKVWCEEEKKNIAFTINHFTLTLPDYQVKSYTFKSGRKIEINDSNPLFVAFPWCVESVEYNYSDKYIKHELLNHFFTILRRDYHVDAYVWRAETQANGNIHFHVSTNKFIYLADLRNEWNKVLSKTDMLDKYHARFCEMSYEQYKSYRIAQWYRNSKNKNSKAKPTNARMLVAYRYGKKTNWYNPNSTDIHAVWRVKNMAAYLSSYFSKKQFLKREIDGCLWRLSKLLSMLKKEVVHVQDDVGKELAYLWKHFKNRVKCKDYASIFCFKISDINNIIKDSIIVKKFREYRDSVLSEYNRQKNLVLS